MALTDSALEAIDLTDIPLVSGVALSDASASPVAAEAPIAFDMIGGDLLAGRALAEYVNLRTQTFWLDSLADSSADSDEARIYEAYLPERDALLAAMNEKRDAFIAVLQTPESQRLDVATATAQFDTIETALSEHLADSPHRAQNPAAVFSYLNSNLSLDYSLDEINEREYEREARRRSDLKQILSELDGAHASGGSVFRIFGGLGQLDVPTQSIGSADAMGAAHDFLARTNANGLTNFSPTELAEQQAILGVLSQAAVEQLSLRSVINTGVHTLAEGVPELLATMGEAGNAFTPFGLQQFISSETGAAAFADLGDDARASLNAFLERGGEGIDLVNYRVTQHEIVRINTEVWQLMVDGRQGQYMGYDTEISSELLAQLPESVRDRLGERPKLFELALLLDPSIRPLATMYTGAMAHAPAQNYQLPYHMGYHDVGLWGGAFRGTVASNMEQYAIPAGGTVPATPFDINVRPANPHEWNRDTISGDEAAVDLPHLPHLPRSDGALSRG